MFASRDGHTGVAELLLAHYYDAMYLHQAKKRPGHVRTFECDTSDAAAAAARVMSEAAGA